MNEATNESAGCATSSLGVPDWRSRAVDDDADLVGERRRVLEVVRDEQRRDLEPGEQLVQLGADRRLRVRVERGERLVEEQHLRVAGERAGERDALPLAAGELAGMRVREVPDPEPLEVLVGRVPARVLDVRRARSGAGRARSPGRRARRAAAPAQVDAAAASNQTSSSTAIAPGLRPHEPGDRAQDGRLAGAGRPDERERRADLEAQPELERPKRDGDVSRMSVAM